VGGFADSVATGSKDEVAGLNAARDDAVRDELAAAHAVKGDVAHAQVVRRGRLNGQDVAIADRGGHAPAGGAEADAVALAEELGGELCEVLLPRA
jgi:hypothetical protein